jgi:hypothetical protein
VESFDAAQAERTGINITDEFPFVLGLFEAFRTFFNNLPGSYRFLTACHRE